MNYGQRFGDNADWYVNASWQHVGNRYTQPGDQERFNEVFIVGSNGMAFFDPSREMPVKKTLTGVRSSSPLTTWSICLPELNGITAWQSRFTPTIFSMRMHSLSFDRERGGRARQGFNIGTPRTVGVTTRIKFGH